MKTSHPLTPKISSHCGGDSLILQTQRRLGPAWANFIQNLSSNDYAAIGDYWDFTARPDQKPPSIDWLVWILLGGRGCGKTRTGAEWISRRAETVGRIALIAPNLNDAREVMLEGESGLLNIGFPRKRPRYIASRRRLEWPNGALGYLFSAEDPDSLRGPQFNAAWADEFCAWAYPEAALANLRLGLRLGDKPQLVMTTTPRPIPALIKLMQAKSTIVYRAKTQDNYTNLSPAFLSMMEDTYGGTRLGRQELSGEILLDQAHALWSYAMIEACQYREDIPALDRIVISLDPPVTSGEKSDHCGIIVAGRQGQGRTAKAFVLQDASIQGVSPERWARTAIDLFKAWEADELLVEVNQGGDLVKTVIGSIDPNIPVKTVFATKSKKARAEPVAAFYEQGRVVHAARLEALESELLTLGTSAQKGSPDRADALVWAVTHLLTQGGLPPKIRSI